MEIYLAPVVQTLDSAIHQAPVVQTLDSAIQRLNNRGLVVSAIFILNNWGYDNYFKLCTNFFCLPSDGISKFIICNKLFYFRTLQLRRVIRRLKLQDFPPGGTLFACWDHEFKNCLIRFIMICCYGD